MEGGEFLGVPKDDALLPWGLDILTVYVLMFGFIFLLFVHQALQSVSVSKSIASRIQIKYGRILFSRRSVPPFYVVVASGVACSALNLNIFHIPNYRYRGRSCSRLFTHNPVNITTLQESLAWYVSRTLCEMTEYKCIYIQPPRERRAIPTLTWTSTSLYISVMRHLNEMEFWGLFYISGRVHQWSACACVYECRMRNEGMKPIKVVCGSVFPALEFVVSARESLNHQSWYKVYNVFMSSREFAVHMLNSSF